MNEHDFSADRQRMLREDLAARDIRDPAVLRAMEAVPRERFVLPTDYDEAYADHPLPIGCRQTISQPYIVAYMTQLLEVRPGMKVLELGTGSGYQTAVLLEMGAEVVSVERHEALLEQAVDRLQALGYTEHVDFRIADSDELGCAEEAPYDRIVVAAASPRVPQSLVAQLGDDARMVIPVGTDAQSLMVVSRQAGEVRMRKDISVLFVKLIGDEAFADNPE